MLVKEAVYAAMSHSATEFRQAKDQSGQLLLDYRLFLSQHLLLEAFSSDPRYATSLQIHSLDRHPLIRFLVSQRHHPTTEDCCHYKRVDC